MEPNAYLETRIAADTFSIQWTVNDFDNCILGQYESVRSATFYPPGAENLGFALELKYNTDAEARLSLVTLPKNREESKKLKARANFKAFVNPTEKVYEKTSALLTISTEKECELWSDPLKTIKSNETEINGRTHRWHVLTKPPKNVTIHFELIIFKPPVTTTSGRYDHHTQHIHDLQRMFQEKEFADCVLIVAGEEFPASKAILSARSPVFKAELNGSFEEAKTLRSNVEGVSANVMRKLLEYIYKGSVDEMEECADGLLAAGHRYQVEGIQLLAAEALAKEIAVENVCQLLVTADLYGSVLLKSQCSSYIAQHRRAVIKTEAWKTLISGSNAHLLAELIEGAAEVEEST